MPFLSPSAARVPSLSLLLADQAEPPRRVARHLEVSLRTLKSYAATGNAPRAVYLALWLESCWGIPLDEDKKWIKKHFRKTSTRTG